MAPGRPEVIVEFLFQQGLLFVAVRNIGGRAAAKISVQFDPGFTGLQGTRDIGSQALFRNIEFLGPGREIVTFLDSSSSYFARQQPTLLTARVEYRDLEGQWFTQGIRHDLEIYRDLIYIAASDAEQF